MAINFNIHLMKHNFMKFNEAGPNVCSKISKEVSQGKYLKFLKYMFWKHFVMHDDSREPTKYLAEDVSKTTCPWCEVGGVCNVVLMISSRYITTCLRNITGSHKQL